MLKATAVIFSQQKVARMVKAWLRHSKPPTGNQRALCGTHPHACDTHSATASHQYTYTSIHACTMITYPANLPGIMRFAIEGYVASLVIARLGKYCIVGVCHTSGFGHLSAET